LKISKEELQNRLKTLVNSETKSLNESVKTLFESTSIEEEQKAQFASLIEEAVSAKTIELSETVLTTLSEELNSYAEYVKEELETKSEKYCEYVVESLTTSLDAYLNKVVSEYMTENKLAINAGLKVEMFESLVGSLKNLFVENNIEVPDEKVDVVAELQEELDEKEKALNSLVLEMTDVKKQLEEVNKKNLIKEAVANLAETQKEKVFELTEGLDSKSSEFESKLKQIVEAISSTKVTAPVQVVVKNDKKMPLMESIIKAATATSSFDS